MRANRIPGLSGPQPKRWRTRRLQSAQYSPLITKRAADRPGEFRLLSRELERAELGGDLHPFGELEPDGSLRIRFVERVQDVDREPVLVEHVGPSDVFDLEARCL